MTDPYLYPGTRILRNKLNIRDREQLDIAERVLTTQRWVEGPPPGRFDLEHLRTIHHHLFQDIYAWAGETRTVPLSKGATQFMPFQAIETGMGDIHRRLAESDYLQGTSVEAFAHQAGRVIGDLNHVHPFREGNGRTQMVYLDQLAAQAGHLLALERLDEQPWIDASVSAHYGNYDGMSEQIRRMVSPQITHGSLSQLEETAADHFESPGYQNIGGDVPEV